MARQRYAFTGFWTFWIRTPAASSRRRSEIFSAAAGSRLDLDFAEKTLLVVCLTYIKPEVNGSRIACVPLVRDQFAKFAKQDWIRIFKYQSLNTSTARAANSPVFGPSAKVLKQSANNFF